MDFRMPAEWEPHDACWVAWPSHANLWGEDLALVQDEFTRLCKAIAPETLKVLVPTQQRRQEAQSRLAGLGAEFFDIAFGDIWLRDTAPIFVRKATGELAASTFQFNGWGGKYDLPDDPEVSGRIAEAFQGPVIRNEWILEGGSVEVDGEGTCLTTEQCLLNPNRNPSLNRRQIEDRLKTALGVSKVLWITEGLLNDHTDGHIDTIARFIAPGKVVCMSPSGKDDPNAEVLEKIASELAKMQDAQGRTLQVYRVPSPGKILTEDGDVMPASYVNFYLSNHSLIIPTYGGAHDGAAVAALSKLFPNRRTVGTSAIGLLTGGGAFHCITQQQPRKDKG